jgi:serine/threonine protein kinase
MRVREVQEEPVCMVVMDYFPLGNIRHFVLDLPEQMIAFRQLLRGVAYLHEARVVHGNIKPENIMIQRLPVFKVVITDIGLSAVDDYSRMTKTFWSAANYQAPERFPEITKLVDSFDDEFALIDVWSLGVVMLELSHGLPEPPTWPDLDQSLRRVLQSEWRPLLDIWLDRIFNTLDHILNHNDPGMVEVVALLTDMLQDEPGNRPSARRCLDRHFRELNSHEQVNTERPVDTTSEHDPVFSSSDDDDWEAEAQCGGSPMVETTSDAQHDLAELVDAAASLSSPIADDSEESQDSEESEEL